MNVNVKRLHDDAILPSYDLPGDAGIAMHTIEGAVLAPGERHVFSCGWALEFEEGYVAIVFDRGSVGAIRGLKQLGGVFDANYRGEYNVCLVNLSGETQEIKKGDKVAQLIILPFATATFDEMEILGESVRGDKRFGSTGR